MKYRPYEWVARQMYTECLFGILWYSPIDSRLMVQLQPSVQIWIQNNISYTVKQQDAPLLTKDRHVKLLDFHIEWGSFFYWSQRALVPSIFGSINRGVWIMALWALATKLFARFLLQRQIEPPTIPIPFDIYTESFRYRRRLLDSYRNTSIKLHLFIPLTCAVWRKVLVAAIRQWWEKINFTQIRRMGT